ncbi:unnamed protein product [Symbiodinium sp. CCMP2592]|nr:unnamed protein product [Symbiodinium sp. CCMP2592]
MSRVGKRAYHQGPTAPIFIAHAKLHVERQTPLILLENVQDLNVAMVEYLYGRHYVLHPFRVNPGDVGHAAASRPRLYIILAHKQRVVETTDVEMLFQRATSMLRRTAQTQVQDYFVANTHDMYLEASATAAQRKKRYNIKAKSWKYLLNEREKKTLSVLTKFKRSADTDPNLVIFLGDNPNHTVGWSATSGKVPTLRMNTGKMFVPSRQRWMTPREKLTLMGFPVVPRVALAMGVPMLPITDHSRAGQVLGNCMHFGCVLLMEFLALTCFSPRGCSSGRARMVQVLPDPDSEAEDGLCT